MFTRIAFIITLAASAPAAEWFVAPAGNDRAPGTQGQPFASVRRAQAAATAGDSVVLRGGTYRMEESMIARRDRIWAFVILLDKSGSPGKPIRYRAADGEKPVFDFSQVKPDGMRVHAFQVSGSYLHLEGIAVTGVQVTATGHTQSVCFSNTGSHNRYERLAMHDGMAIGYYLTRGKDNLVLNCDAWNNHDPVSGDRRGGNVDGFGAHPQQGDTGNVFRGCRAWFNADDGFDCIAAGESVRYENCWAFYNGFSPDFKSLADGNGFKAGGYGSTPAKRLPRTIPRHTVVRCLAVGNKSNGFYANHHPGGVDWIHNSALANRRSNYNFLCRDSQNQKDVPGPGHVIRNNLGYKAGTEVTNIDEAACQLAGNLFGSGLGDRDFLSLDTTALTAPRIPDGGLPEIPLMHPAPAGKIVDRGVPLDLPFTSRAPDPGAYEAPAAAAAP